MSRTYHRFLLFRFRAWRLFLKFFFFFRYVAFVTSVTIRTFVICPCSMRELHDSWLLIMILTFSFDSWVTENVDSWPSTACDISALIVTWNSIIALTWSSNLDCFGTWGLTSGVRLRGCEAFQNIYFFQVGYGFFCSSSALTIPQQQSIYIQLRDRKSEPSFDPIPQLLFDHFAKADCSFLPICCSLIILSAISGFR